MLNFRLIWVVMLWRKWFIPTLRSMYAELVGSQDTHIQHVPVLMYVISSCTEKIRD